jgi:hypothetical protein
MAINQESFEAIVVELAKNTKRYEDKVIKHYQYADQIENVFANFGVNKTDFYRELNIRCGVETNDTRTKKRAVVVKQKTKKKAL